MFLNETTANRALNSILITLDHCYKGTKKPLVVCEQPRGWCHQSCVLGSPNISTFAILFCFLSCPHPIMDWPRTTLLLPECTSTQQFPKAPCLMADRGKFNSFFRDLGRGTPWLTVTGPSGFPSDLLKGVIPVSLPSSFPPLEWCYRYWHSNAQTWNVGQWLLHSWEMWAFLPSLVTMGIMPLSQEPIETADFTVCYGQNAYVESQTSNVTIFGDRDFRR